MQKILSILSYAIAIYLLVFALDFMLLMGCVQQYGYNQCGDDTLSRVVRVTHAPIIKFLTK